MAKKKLNSDGFTVQKVSKRNTYKIIKQEYNVVTGHRKTWVELKPVKKPKK